MYSNLPNDMIHEIKAREILFPPRTGQLIPHKSIIPIIRYSFLQLELFLFPAPVSRSRLSVQSTFFHPRRLYLKEPVSSKVYFYP